MFRRSLPRACLADRTLVACFDLSFAAPGPLATSSSELEVKREIVLYSLAMENVLTISEISRRSGVASSALRFYEELGLIASERAGSGHRRYPRSVLRRIAFIVFAQRIGLSLDEIGSELGKLPADHVPTRRDWGRLSREWTKRIDERIAELERLRSGLTECIGCGCLSIDRCKLANPADRAGRRGSGPRYWLG
jgi:MerR family redox-sensitive transcriptional activator SoxR